MIPQIRFPFAARCWSLLFALAVAPLAADDAAKEPPKPLAPAQLYKQCLPSVLTLQVKYADDTDGFGTGFLALKEGCAVTAWHVVRNARSVTAKFADGEEFDVSGVVDHDEKRDLALVRVKVAARPQLTMSPADPEVGARAYVIGAPKGLEFSLSDGLISQIRTAEGKKSYQFSSPISSGNSGGPLILEDGKVAGIVRSQIVEGQNLNFAVPAVYALGLDSSLPTKPWDQLVEPETGTLTPEKIPDVILGALIMLLDATEVVSRTYNDVSMTKDAYQKGVPDYLTQCKSDVDFILGLLSKLREKKLTHPLLEPMETPLQIYAKTLNGFTEAIEAAVEQKGWTKEALALHNVAMESWNAAAKAEAPLYDLFTEKKIPEDLEPRFIEVLVSTYDSDDDSSQWELGIRMLASEPMVVFRLLPTAWARKLELQEGDHILTVDGTSVETPLALKEALEQKVGRSVAIKVKRKGKEEILTRKVPPIKKKTPKK